MPVGLDYINTYVTENDRVCYQLMQANDLNKLNK